ncbi:MAG: nucleotidyltransferase domain-containing protein [Desulfotignum sp.]
MIKEKITHYFETRHEAAAVYLFGSFASEKNHPASDVDLAILFLPAHLPSADRFCDRYITKLGRLLRKDIHPVVMNRVKKQSAMPLEKFLASPDAQDIVLFNLHLAVQGCIDMAKIHAACRHDIRDLSAFTAAVMTAFNL